MVMEKKLNNILEYKHIRESTNEILSYIDNRRKGIVNSLKTRWDKFNNACMGGIEPNIIITIAGISGSGKSSFANSLETDLFDLNPKANFVVLSFTLEMLSSRQVGRKLSYKMKKTTSELYSGHTGKNLSNEDYQSALKHSEKIREYPIYYVDRPGTTEEIRNTIKYFQSWLVPMKKWLIVILDHTLLTRGKQGQGERETLADLQKVFMEAKKVGVTTIIQLSQLNRNIESPERINNSNLHYPQRSDLFGSDFLFQTSDLLLVIHRPETLHIQERNEETGQGGYGPKHLSVKNMIYIHIVKNREGEPKILSFVNNLKYNSIEEPNPFNNEKE